MRVDDRATFFADGSKIADVENKLTRNIIPKATRVVAVQAYNGEGKAFILAGFSNEFKTDTEKWKCTDQFYPGWKTVDYDDSHWRPAVEIDRDDLDGRAIWTDEVHKDSYVYCRGYIGE